MFNIGKSILSPNIIELLNDELYWLGLSYIERTYRSMTSLRTINNEYTLLFDRCNSNSPYGEYNYICSITIKDMIGTIILQLSFNEIYAFTVIDNLAQFINFNQDKLIILNTNDTYMNNYLMSIEKDTNTDLYTVKICRYNNATQYELQEVLHFYLNEDLLSSMIDFMYFSYLIDIDNDDYISHISNVIPDG